MLYMGETPHSRVRPAKVSGSPGRKRPRSHSAKVISFYEFWRGSSSGPAKFKAEVIVFPRVRRHRIMPRYG